MAMTVFLLALLLLLPRPPLGSIRSGVSDFLDLPVVVVYQEEGKSGSRGRENEPRFSLANRKTGFQKGRTAGWVSGDKVV